MRRQKSRIRCVVSLIYRNFAKNSCSFPLWIFIHSHQQCLQWLNATVRCYTDYGSLSTADDVVRRSESSWIGLLKNSSSSTDPSPSEQHWLDGSTSTFRRWQTGEPDGSNTRCVRMDTSGEFKDSNCEDEYGFVCKRTIGSYKLRDEKGPLYFCP